MSDTFILYDDARLFLTQKDCLQYQRIIDKPIDNHLYCMFLRDCKKENNKCGKWMNLNNTEQNKEHKIIMECMNDPSAALLNLNYNSESTEMTYWMRIIIKAIFLGNFKKITYEHK
jgi:hypothetical protein